MGVSGEDGTMKLSNDPMGDQKMGINDDGTMNMGIINQYGQLMGEFSRLDDELWLCKSDDDDGFVQSSGDFHWDIFSSNVDLKKLSHIVDNSFCNGVSSVAKGSSSSLVDYSLDQSPNSPPTPTPQSKRSYSNIRTSVTKRARTKRHRPSKCDSHFKKQDYFSPTEDYMDCPLLDEMAEPAIRTKKVEDLLQSRDSKPRKGNSKPNPKRKISKKAIKKCSHCESTRTPQWREGPLGRGTLCNACGVQFKHGRLFPEYRPLSSPHFDPSLHSNLPKKVQQMRMNKKC